TGRVDGLLASLLAGVWRRVRSRRPMLALLTRLAAAATADQSIEVEIFEHRPVDFFRERARRDCNCILTRQRPTDIGVMQTSHRVARLQAGSAWLDVCFAQLVDAVTTKRVNRLDRSAFCTSGDHAAVQQL